MPENVLEPGVLVADTITKMPPEAKGAVIISGSHGGVYPGYLSAKAHVRAVILNDAGVGKDAAGIESLSYLEALGIAAAVVSHLSCRIGDTADMLARGVISCANAPARAVGVGAGMSCREAARALTRAEQVAAHPPPLREGRDEVPGPGPRRILLLDSAAMVLPEDAGHIVVTGSHGGLVGGIPAMALRTDGFAAVFSDAGIGIDGAGTTRLPALDSRAIAAVTVSAASARIGDARSIFEHGVVSVANKTAVALGAQLGHPVRDILRRWATITNLVGR
jgi:uncharacterized protein YunC (DUF1805 family)